MKEFSPYKEVKEINEEARKSGAELIRGSIEKKRQGYIYGNNRLEGNALGTIGGMLATAD